MTPAPGPAAATKPEAAVVDATATTAKPSREEKPATAAALVARSDALPTPPFVPDAAVELAWTMGSAEPEAPPVEFAPSAVVAVACEIPLASPNRCEDPAADEEETASTLADPCAWMVPSPLVDEA